MRTIFNNIISTGNLVPKPNTEYIYNLDMMWPTKKGLYDTINVKPGIIVENVQQLDADNYSFNIKGDEEIYNCTYGWVFIENTQRNIDLLKEIDIEEQKLNEQKLILKKLRNKLDSLYNNEQVTNPDSNIFDGEK